MLETRPGNYLFCLKFFSVFCSQIPLHTGIAVGLPYGLFIFNWYGSKSSWLADSRLWNSKFYFWFTGDDSTCSATSVSNPYSHTCFCHLLAVCLSYVFISLRSLFHCATAPSGPGPPHYGCLSITLRFNTFGWTPLDERSSRRRDLYLTTHNTDKKDFHALGGVRPRNPNKPATADPHIRERGHWNLCPAYRPKVCVYFSHHHMC
jgi:hypothetical protein